MRTGTRHSQSSDRVLQASERICAGGDPDLPLSTTTDILTAVAQAVPQGREAQRADTPCRFFSGATRKAVACLCPHSRACFAGGSRVHKCFGGID
jgi:hypothetical protein